MIKREEDKKYNQTQIITGYTMKKYVLLLCLNQDRKEKSLNKVIAQLKLQNLP